MFTEVPGRAASRTNLGLRRQARVQPWRLGHPAGVDADACKAPYSTCTPRTNYSVVRVRRDGTPIVVEIFGNLARLQDRRVLTCVVQDISERKRAEREILALQEHLRAL